MSAIENAIQCMHKYHECYKNGNDEDSEAIEYSIGKPHWQLRTM